MSNFKIIGNPNPIVGVEEFYSVETFFQKILPFQNQAKEDNSFEHLVEWEVYILELGKWRKTKENDKTGNKITYKFRQGSLKRKGIRILARKGDQITRLDIHPQPSEKAKIDDVKLLDKSGKKIVGHLSYGQTVKARVHCLHMEKQRIYVTLWEDDVKGAGHNKANETNFIETKSGIVKDGIADVDFILRPSFSKIAERGGHEKDKVHEYYVTAQLDKEKIPSNNINVDAPEIPVAPFKGKTTPKEPVKTEAPKPKEKTEPTKSKTPETPKTIKGKINSVNITDTAGNKIQGIFKQKQIKIWINSTGLKEKEIRIKLFEHDYGTPNDLLLSENITIKSDLHAWVVSLDTISRTLGGNYLEEGSEQELFAEVEVLQTHDFIKSAVVDVDATVFKQDEFEVFDKLFKVFMPDEKEEKKENNCGEKYCIKIGDESELIREINIRLAGFGGNVPTDQFTDRTEKMIKQFQRDYMKVPETGKICGNVLKAIDDFKLKYFIHFDDIKCKCGKCEGFGNGKFQENKQNSKIVEAYRKYEYPGIHRSLVWALRAVMFYSSTKEKELGYSVKCISSGYRCDEDNKQHKRNSTNHMGKALDIHFNKNGKRTLKRPDIILEMEEIRLKIFNKYLGAKWDWKSGQQNIFNLESTAAGAKTWIHYDVREYDLEYLKDGYFAKTSSELDGESILKFAKEINPNICSCMGSGNSISQFPVIAKRFQVNNFTVDDGKEALKVIYDKYGKEMATIIERMYRDETAHFTSGQYKACGTGGMESFGNAPYYGWDESFFEENSDFKPIGLWSAYENKGMSGLGGNKQVIDKEKSFVVLPSVLAGMEYKVFYINKYNGNWARWTSTNPAVQETYKKYINTITAKFVNEFESKK